MDFSEHHSGPFPHFAFIDLFVSLPSMSTTSTTTALAARDQTLGIDFDLVNHMCVLTITRGDGTPFGANSLHEEDVVELCVSVGQADTKVY